MKPAHETQKSAGTDEWAEKGLIPIQKIKKISRKSLRHDKKFRPWIMLAETNSVT